MNLETGDAFAKTVMIFTGVLVIGEVGIISVSTNLGDTDVIEIEIVKEVEKPETAVEIIERVMKRNDIIHTNYTPMYTPVPVPTPTPTPTPQRKVTYEGQINTVIAYAAKKLKNAYTYGGAYKDDKFDCSSLVQGAYAEIGVYLPRTSYGQSSKGIKVDSKHLKEGDLLFYLTNKKRGVPVTHVGLYIGDGKMIHAKGKKYGITVDKVSKYAKLLVVAKRII